MLDRLSILEIKVENLSGDQSDTAARELASLRTISEKMLEDEFVRDAYEDLKLSNFSMWTAMEKTYNWIGSRLSHQFSELVFEIIQENKVRAEIKKKIDLHIYGQAFEAKSFFQK